MQNLPSTHWPRVLTLWCCGIVAAMQFAKISVAFDALQHYYAVGPATMGWILSAVGSVGLVIGVSMGLLAPRIGYRRLLLTGLLLGGVVSLAQSWMLPVSWLWGSRMLEGVSQVSIVVAAPTLMASYAAPQHRAIAMGLWSTFVGVAFAITGALGLPFITHWGLPALFQAHALGFLLVVLAVLLWVPAGAVQARAKQAHPAHTLMQHVRALLRQHLHIYIRWTTVLPGLCFFGFTSMSVALLTFLPSQSRSSGTWFAAVLPLMGVAGTFLAGWVAQYWLTPLRLVRAAFALVLASAVLWGLASWIGWGSAVAALVLVLCSGFAGGAAFSLVPYLNPDAGQQARANGAVAQLGSLGATLGPPCFAFALALLGQTGLVVCVALGSCFGLALGTWGAVRYRQHPL